MDGDTTAAVINNLVNEHSSLTADTNGAVVAFNGDWPADSQFALVLEGRGDAQMWMVPNGKAREGRSSVQATKQGTVNQPGSHPRLLAVGCTINRLDWDGARRRPAHAGRPRRPVGAAGGQRLLLQRCRPDAARRAQAGAVCARGVRRRRDEHRRRSAREHQLDVQRAGLPGQHLLLRRGREVRDRQEHLDERAGRQRRGRALARAGTVPYAGARDRGADGLGAQAARRGPVGLAARRSRPEARARGARRGDALEPPTRRGAELLF